MDARRPDHLFDLTGRTALITGGTRGIGRAIAEGFVLAGAHVVVASRKAEACAETASHLEGLGGSAVGVAANMGDADTPARIVAAAIDAFGGLDIVVNNAANALAQPLGSQTVEAWQKSFEVNLRGPALMCQAALPHLATSDHASVINVTSIGAFTFAGGLSIYAAMKAATVSITRSFASEMAPHGIRVNALAPGIVDTDMSRAAGALDQVAASTTLLGRMASPAEMIGPAVFLASDASSFMTGQVLAADGGMHPL